MRFIELKDSGFTWFKSFLDNPKFDRLRALLAWLLFAVMLAALYVMAPLDDFIAFVKAVALLALISYVFDFIRKLIKRFKNRSKKDY